MIKPLNVELNPICHLLALLEAHHILHVSMVRVKLTLVTYLLLISRNRVLLQELIGSQLLKKFPAFYGTGMSITGF